MRYLPTFWLLIFLPTLTKLYRNRKAAKKDENKPIDAPEPELIQVAPGTDFRDLAPVAAVRARPGTLYHARQRLIE